jgi:hypothetical protein
MCIQCLTPAGFLQIALDSIMHPDRVSVAMAGKLYLSRRRQTVSLAAGLFLRSHTIRHAVCTSGSRDFALTEIGPGCPKLMFTPCDTLTQTRNAVYYYGADSVCAPNAVLPPPAVTPCSALSAASLRHTDSSLPLSDLTCGSGAYLPAGTRKCESCIAGTYSIGGGIRFSSWCGLA